MKNLKTILVALLFTITMFGQWEYKKINNGFDDPFKKAYTKLNNYGFLTMEGGDIFEEDFKPFLALYGTYFCDDNTIIDLVFIVNGVSKLYNLEAYKSDNSSLYIFYNSIWTYEFTQDFKNASKCKIRVNQSYCKDEYYEFNFTGSTAAFNFMTKIN